MPAPRCPACGRFMSKCTRDGCKLYFCAKDSPAEKHHQPERKLRLGRKR